MAMMVQAIGVFVAAPKTAANPRAARKENPKGIITESALPKVVPTNTRGINSPPLKPVPTVKDVKRDLSTGSLNDVTCSSEA